MNLCVGGLTPKLLWAARDVLVPAGAFLPFCVASGVLRDGGHQDKLISSRPRD